jgi:hypothetical protein
VLEKAGAAWLLRDGVRQATPFLDLRGAVSTQSEEGLLGLAFAPDWATSHLVYVDYTAPDRTITVAEYRTAGDRIDPATQRVVLRVAHPTYGNHNGGQLAFGPDGDLYVGVGDGGSGGDPDGHGQDPTQLLGKILRIDPRAASPYGIPAGNPFTQPNRPEIWAYGLRNPWRFSFDRLTGDLWIGDVGQNAWEEVDEQPAGAGGGRNYGWDCLEGTHTTSYASPSCPAENATPPVLEYAHAGTGRCAVTGGYVVRDPSLDDLAGRYLFGDYCTGETFVHTPGGAGFADSGLDPLPQLTSFGEDGCGHLYAATGSGPVYRLQTRQTAPCPETPPGGGGGGGGGGGSGGSGGPAARGPHVRVAVAGRATRKGRVPLKVRCPAGAGGQCFGRVRLRRAHIGHRLALAAFSVPAGARRTVHPRLSKLARRKLSRRHRLGVTAVARARDAGGAAAGMRIRKVTLRAYRAGR